MKRTLALCMILAGPVAADPYMSPDDCTQAWDQFTRKINATIPGRITAYVQSHGTSTDAADTRWCVIDTPLHDTAFDRVMWRAEGIDAFINGDQLPTRFEMQIDGLQIKNTHTSQHTFALEIQRVPDMGLLLIENISLTGTDGSKIAGTAVIGGAFFSTISNAVVSLGGLHLTKLAAHADVTPKMFADLAPDAVGFDYATAISELSFTQFDRPSRSHLMSFAADLPNATGDLEFDFQSERGLGIGQLYFARGLTPAAALAFVISGAAITMEWHPE